MRQQQDDFRRLAGIGKREHGVGARDHSEVAVRRLGGMQKERGRAGARQRGRDLAGDVPGFAHSGDDDATLAVEADVAGLREPRTIFDGSA